MKYLNKNSNSKIIDSDLIYSTNSKKNIELRTALLNEQKGFCAYTEKYIRETDSCDIEHFDPRKKNTNEDSYYNWYVVISWINQRKPKKIDNYLPILEPYSQEFSQRIKYDEGLYFCIDKDDKEAENLIKFLLLNSPEIYKERKNHLDQIKFIKESCDNDEMFFELMKSSKTNFNFITVLETELNFNFQCLLES